MTTPTTLPVPSSDPRDLLFNAQALDAILNSSAQTYSDRFGGARSTVAGAVAQALASISSVNNRGAWAALTGYSASTKDIVLESGTWYICVVTHTSSASFATDLATKWKVYQGLTSADLQKYIGESVSLRNFGSLANNGSTDDASLFQLAAASGAPVIDARGVNCRIGSAINIPSNQVWLLQGAKLNFASSTITGFNCAAVSNFALLGPFTITGDGSTVGTAKGIRVSDCANFLIDRPILKSIKGWGIYVEPGSSTTLRSDHGVIREPRIDACYIGYEDAPGTGSEYGVVESPHITRCTLFAVKTAAGNTAFEGGRIVDNVAVGAYIGNGTNHAHGSFNGTIFAHNGSYGVDCDHVTNGELLSGCRFFENPIRFNCCKGINLVGGLLDCSIVVEKDGSTEPTVIRDMYCAGGYGGVIVTSSSSASDMVLFQNCHGAGAVNASRTINDPSPVYVHAQRNGGTGTQSLAAASLTRLIAPTEIFDRRNAFDNATGIFTVPAGQWGQYRVSASLICVGTGMSATASFVTIRVNGTDKRLQLPSINSTTKLVFNFDCDLYLAAGDTVEIMANISGTTPAFGDSAFDSSITIEKKA